MSQDKSAAEQPESTTSVYQLKVTIVGTKPPVWRRVLVDGTATLNELHKVIQAAFGWWNCHLHDFEVGRTRYALPNPDWDFGPPALDERSVRLDEVASEGTSFHYTYDFGDDWRHKVAVEKVIQAEPTVVTPDCIGGRRACPPEDCGGVWGYQGLLDALNGNTQDEDDLDRLSFLAPDFDPAAFDPSDFAFNLANVVNVDPDIF